MMATPTGPPSGAAGGVGAPMSAPVQMHVSRPMPRGEATAGGKGGEAGGGAGGGGPGSATSTGMATAGSSSLYGAESTPPSMHHSALGISSIPSTAGLDPLLAAQMRLRAVQSAAIKRELPPEGAVGNVLIDRIVEQRQRDRVEDEARRREQAARAQGSSIERIVAARRQESRNPMRLAKLLRVQLFSLGRKVCQPAQPEAAIQVPHLNGDWAEQMLVTVYRKYTNDRGFMSLEEFVEFMEDSNVLQTHVPHDEDDEPLEEFQSQLDPVHLVTTIPRNLGVVQEAVHKEAELDEFHINFTQFYHLLLRIAEIVYGDLYREDSAEAMHKLLQEVVLPLYSWSQGHDKRGCTDELLLEGRIALLLQTYAPNLWRVFLFYAQDYHNRLPSITLRYPECAQASEMAMFGKPNELPLPPNMDSSPIGYFIKDTHVIHFAEDFGVIPSIMTRAQVLAMMRKVMVEKDVSIPTPEYTRGAESGIQLTASHWSTRRQVELEMSSPLRPPSPPPFLTGTPDEDSSPRRPQPPKTRSGQPLAERGGLSFTEFLEFLAQVALQGLSKPCFHELFPDAYAKLLALLTMYAVSDLSRLKEIKIMRHELPKSV